MFKVGQTVYRISNYSNEIVKCKIVPRRERMATTDRLVLEWPDEIWGGVDWEGISDAKGRIFFTREEAVEFLKERLRRRFQEDMDSIK